MKKKILFTILLFISITSTYALTKKFTIDSSTFSFTNGTKNKNILSEFSKDYSLTYNISSSNEELKNEITLLSKKVTYLLLGESDMSNETAEEYFKRRHDYLEMRYNPEIPKNPNSLLGLDENSEEYRDDIVSGISVPSMFNILDELNIVYNSIGSIKISINDDLIISMVSLPDIKMKVEDYENHMNYINKKTNLVIYYYFKKLGNEYKLYYLFAETTEDLNDFFDDAEELEGVKSLSIVSNYDSKLNDIYDFSKMYSLEESSLNEIYNNNVQNLLILNSYYDTTLVSTANGFLINNGLVVTTWNFIEKSLINSQYFTVKDNLGNTYDVDGIVTINPETDIVVIKLKEKIQSNTILGSIDDIQIEDPVISISSKLGIGLTLQTGIIISKDGYLQSVLPLAQTDEGSPLYNSYGQVIGMNTAKSVSTSISFAIDSTALREIQNKFESIEFDTIDYVTFDDLKEKYYYANYYEENIINNIPTSKWNEFKKIGNIENNIKLELRKANYDNNVISLRYYNGMSEYISAMQLASSFKEELKNSGFEQILDSNTKCVYKNNKYKVIIMDEFDYLIVVMTKL